MQAARRAMKWALDQGFEPAGLHAYTKPDEAVACWRIRAKHPATADKIFFADAVGAVRLRAGRARIHWRQARLPIALVSGT